MSEDDANYITAFGIDEKFLTVIALTLSAIVSIHICFGQNTRKTREYAIMLLLLVLVSVQYYHLGNVVTYIPSSKFFVYDSNLLKPECQRSGKGGKRAMGSNEVYDENPCFCDPSAGICRDEITDEIITGECPRNGTAKCFMISNPTDWYPEYLDVNRNCRGGQGSRCTKDNPCYPCDIDSVVAFKAERCRACATDFPGDCNFIPDIGPYCFESPQSRKAVPCKKCCTEPVPGVIVNSTCY